MAEEVIINRGQTIGTSNTVVSDEKFNCQRTFIAIVNNSQNGEVVYLAIGQEATTTNGFKMIPGGYYVESRDNNSFPTNKQINCIASAGTATISIQERTINR